VIGPSHRCLLTTHTTPSYHRSSPASPATTRPVQLLRLHSRAPRRQSATRSAFRALDVSARSTPTGTLAPATYASTGPASPLRPFSAPPPSDCPAPRAHCTAAGSADPRSPQHPPLTVHPHLSAHCDPRSDSSPRFATPPAAAEIDRTGYRTGGRPRPRADQCRPPRGGRAGSLRLRPARGSSLAPSSSHTRATSPTTQRQRKARQK